MPNPRLLAMITAAVMFAPATGVNAEFTLNELQRIEQLIVSKDCGALWSHLRKNPGLTQGADPLAAELRNFANGINGGLVNCLSVQQGTAPLAVQPNVAAAY